MPPPVLPGALWRPGRLAGYARGATRMEINIDHCTAGRNSYNIGLDGYFNILLPKEGAPYQFAETNALTWHAAHMNPFGPGVEIERMSAGSAWRPGLSGWEDLTKDQTYWLKAWHEHCQEWGIPAEHFIGARFSYLGFRGNANHGDVDSMRSDGITDLRLGEDTAEWQVASPGAAPAPAPPKPRTGERMDLIVGPVQGQPTEPSAILMQGAMQLWFFPAKDIVNTFLGRMPRDAADWLGSVTNVTPVFIGGSQQRFGTQNVQVMDRLLGRPVPPVGM